MVTAVDGRLVRFADREPLHVGFLPWWRVVDGPEGGKAGEPADGARDAETTKDSTGDENAPSGRSDGF